MSGDFNPYGLPPSAGGSQATLRGESPYLRPAENNLPKESLTSIPREFAPLLQEQPAPYNSSPLAGKESESGYLTDPRPAKRPFYKTLWFWIAAIIIVAAAVVLPVYFVVIRPKHDSKTSSGSAATASNSTGTTPTTGSAQALVQFGGDGSTVTKDDGTTFIYNNTFGGYWVSNAEDPYDNSARPNSWTPPLNQSWRWGEDRINGVNLGGLFVPEPFIVPELFETNPGAVDEWTLSTILAGKGQLQSVLENHYDTFITEEDIAQIAGAGLNWIRVPIPFWAIETWTDVGVDGSGQTVAEPFLARVCWKYILRLIGWARKYGLRVLLDLHTIPGSQNGYNHSGKLGSLNWLNGPMGLANAERSLDYIRTIVEFISQPEYKDVVQIFGILNEPFLPTIGRAPIESFYLRVYEMVREITGTGEGNGPMISFHDGFDALKNWANFLPGADRIVIDDHPYFAFDGQPNREPVNITADGGDGTQLGGKWPLQACNAWGANMNTSRANFGISVAGEFSNAINDCGLWVIGIGVKPNYGPDCGYWADASQWSDANKQGLLNFALASMDALGDFFFWTWKIGASTTTNTVQAPLWSYKLGLENGWMPKDPRSARGMCESLGVTPQPFNGPFQPWQTGGAGAGTIAPAATASIQQWPPTLQNVPTGGASALPQYTSLATPVTLPPLTPTATASVTVTATAGNGWFDAQDTAPAVTPISGCAYPDAWDAIGAQVPLSGCLPGPTST
ncbi:glycoside hydrolase [Trametes versicolor FP-101664 SS1]|uniref:glycoside hydrolase n=1 Tax=Trametes versicolor (strain FP-101664) TaxID=717944 RepID=UPI0004623E03|nr:glycoside hydrolase [Trametes versicolor FP-101664 SS1]EIW63161.1 glycoside hydrolase [Trametes versicolor FP-101664 SS1]